MNLPRNSVFPNLAFKTRYGLPGPRYAGFAFSGTFEHEYGVCVLARFPDQDASNSPDPVVEPEAVVAPEQDSLRRSDWVSDLKFETKQKMNVCPGGMSHSTRNNFLVILPSKTAPLCRFSRFLIVFPLPHVSFVLIAAISPFAALPTLRYQRRDVTSGRGHIYRNFNVLITQPRQF